VESEGLGAVIAVPMIYEDRLLGALYGANRFRSSFGDRATQVLEKAAGRAAAAAVVAERAKYAAEVAVHEDRRRVAVDLHDTVGAMLFTMGAGIRNFSYSAWTSYGGRYPATEWRSLRLYQNPMY
jgi:signal transduction histidine kinase